MLSVEEFKKLTLDGQAEHLLGIPDAGRAKYLSSLSVFGRSNITKVMRKANMEDKPETADKLSLQLVDGPETPEEVTEPAPEEARLGIRELKQKDPAEQAEFLLALSERDRKDYLRRLPMYDREVLRKDFPALSEDIESTTAKDALPENEEPTQEPMPEAKPLSMENLRGLEALRHRIRSQKEGPAKVSGDKPFGEPPSSVQPQPVGDPNAPGASGFDNTQLLGDHSDGKVRTFDDIMSNYPIGDGEFIVQVERKEPRMYRGAKILGMQRSIQYRTDHTAFASRYGAGSYMLTVYGPMKGKPLGSDGKYKMKAYTKPVKVDIPDPYGENPPNPEMAAVAQAEEDPEMQYSVRRGGASEADAEIEKARLEHESEKEERKRRWEERQREKEEQKERDRENEERDRERRQQTLVEKVLQSKDEELRELRNKRPEHLEALSFMPQLLAAVKPEGPSSNEVQRLETRLEEERRRFAEEIARVRDDNSKEIMRLRDEHGKEMDRSRNENDKVQRDERERADRDRRDRDELHRRELDELRRHYDRQIEDLKTQHQTRLDDERRQHDRDLKNAREMSNTNSTTIQGSFDMRLEVKQQEINRLVQEVSRITAELEHEKNKTLEERVNEFAGAAEALGYSKEDGPKDWRDMLGEAAIGLVQQAPMLAANVMTSLKPPQMMPQLPAAHLQQGAGQMPQQHNYGPVFATDGVDMDLPGGTPDPIHVGQDPYLVYDQEGEEDEDEEETPPVAQQTPPPQHTPEQQAALQQAQKQSAQTGGLLQVDDSQILEFSEMFRAALNQGESPEGFADGIIGQLGPLMAGGIVKEIPLKRVLGILQNAPTADADPLLRRDGQKFLSSVWSLVAKKTS